MHFEQLIHVKCTFNKMYSEVDEGPMHFFIRRCALLQNSGFKPDAQILGDNLPTIQKLSLIVHFNRQRKKSLLLSLKGHLS